MSASDDLTDVAKAVNDLAEACHTMVNTLVDAFRPVVDAIGNFAHLLATTVGRDITRAVIDTQRRLEIILAVYHDDLATRYAIERLDITEVDIRTITSDHIRTWNGRRHHLGPDYRTWAIDRIHTVYATALTRPVDAYRPVDVLGTTYHLRSHL